MIYPRVCYTGCLVICCAFASVALGKNDGKGRQIQGKLSPDGSRVLFVEKKDGDAEIHSARPDGSARRKLTDNDAYDSQPDWSPDGKRIVFVSNSSGQYQIHVMDADGKNVRQLTKGKQASGSPRWGSQGHIAYVHITRVARRDLGEKQSLMDLIIIDGKVSKTIEHDTTVGNMAWSPNGQVLAYGASHGIVFLDVKAGTKKVVPLADIDERLKNNSLLDIRWRPDNQSITCRIVFQGGRYDDGSGNTKMFGDDELFSITRAGKARWSRVNR